MRKAEISKALKEVWDWKDQAYREVAHLDTKEAIRKRLEDSAKAGRSARQMSLRSAR